MHDLHPPKSSSTHTHAHTAQHPPPPLCQVSKLEDGSGLISSVLSGHVVRTGSTTRQRKTMFFTLPPPNFWGIFDVVFLGWKGGGFIVVRGVCWRGEGMLHGGVSSCCCSKTVEGNDFKRASTVNLSSQ